MAIGAKASSDLRSSFDVAGAEPAKRVEATDMEDYERKFECDSKVSGECSMCSGEACQKCGAGCWNFSVTDCEHDVTERHEGPEVTYD